MADEIVDLSYSERACESFSGEMRLLLIQNAGHGFKRREDILAMQAGRQFLLGREELLTVDVHLTGLKRETKGIDSVVTLPFDGVAVGPYFEGVIQSGAANVQKRRWYRPVEFCARYRIKGLDCSGQDCFVEICNRSTDGNRWTPEIRTDSEALSFLNGASCEAVVEGRKTGPIVHGFTEKP